MKRAKPYPLPTEFVLQAENLSAGELRLLVANYYASQEMRKRMDMQLRHLGDRDDVIDEDIPPADRPKGISIYAAESFSSIESQIAKALDMATNNPIGLWLKAQRGIGPVIAAGLLAEIDITKAPTAGHIWSFAGLNPDQKWNKGEKRPFNPDLKVLCWKAGQCFMKQSNDPDCFYGKLYRERKAYEIARNESGANADKAKAFTVSPGATKAVKDKLKDGKMPDFNIDARARRYAVKIFLSHLHAVMFYDHHGEKAPLPYSIAMLHHAHFIDIPHADMIPGLQQAMDKARKPRKKAA